MKIQAGTIRSELDGIIQILSDWQERLKNGIPGEEMPADELSIEVFEMHLRGELMLAANRLTSIVEVLE